MQKSDAFVRESQHLYQPDLPVMQYGYWLLQDTPLARMRSGDRVFLLPLKRTYVVLTTHADGVRVLVRRKTGKVTHSSFWRAVAQVPQGVPPTDQLTPVEFEKLLPNYGRR
jgi:hypothetical protein